MTQALRDCVAPVPVAGSQGGLTLNLLCYNIQVAIGSRRMHHLVSHGWRYVMPHGQSKDNLERIARLVAGHDIVALNEADAGSLRTRYINQAEFLCHCADFNHWDQMITRDLGPFAQHTNSILSRFPPLKTYRHRLPSLRDGRGLLETHFEIGGQLVVVLVTHLSLGRGRRLAQMRYVADVANQYRTVVVMGDLNCTHTSPEMELLLSQTQLCGPAHSPATFPSWNPMRALDHILVSEDLDIVETQAIPEPLSDHLALRAVVRARPEKARLSEAG